MESDFYSIAVPEPTTVLGLRLRPFSLGHVILLNRVKSSFVTEGEELTLHDLALSVLICSLTYEDGLQLFNDTGLGRFFKKWHSKLVGESWLTWLQIKDTRPVDYKAKAVAFADYIRKGSSIPNYSFQPNDFREMNCPSVQLVKVNLMKEMNFTESEILNRSWALCLWDYVTLKAISGQIQMVDGNAIKEAQAAADRLAHAIKEGTCRV